jgi:DNA-directed RNA polymerase subunit RPC12/RpoP
MVIIPPPVEKVFSLLAELLPRLVKKGKMGGQDGYGIPLILAGIAYPLIARSLISGKCPYCGRNVSALNSKPCINCPGCGRHIVIRDKKYFEAQ